MAQVPANQRLWNMYVAQAKAKYRAWPSPTASKWVHDHYVQSGGKFVGSKRDVDPKNRDDRRKGPKKDDDDKGKRPPRRGGKKA